MHCATTRFRDLRQTETLIEAAERAAVEHVVFVSIVGVDEIPYGYYRDKVASEQALIASDLGLTILRATQFHDFVAGFLRAQRRLPLLLVPELPVQPITVEEVAARLVEIAGGPPLGRAEDIGGPEVLPMLTAARQWQRAHGTRRRMLRSPCPAGWAPLSAPVVTRPACPATAAARSPSTRPPTEPSPPIGTSPRPRPT